MRLLTVRRTLGAALVPVLLFGATACGDDKADAGKDSAAWVKESPDADASAPGTEEPAAPEESQGSTPGDDTFEGNDSEGDDSPEVGTTIDADTLIAIMEKGASSMTTGVISAKITAAGQEMTMDGKVDYASKPPKMQVGVTMDTTGGMKMDMIMVDGVMYMGTGDGRYMKMDMSALGEAGMDVTGQLDPTQSVEKMKAGIKTVTFVGNEKKAGTDARHYTIDLDPTKVPDLAKTPGVPADIAYDVWFDSKSRMVAMSMDMGSLSSTTFEITDWGTPVTINAPDPSKVTEVPKGSIPGLGS